MNIITKKTELSTVIEKLKSEGKTVGLVPTMGALHEGHISLVKACKKGNDIAVVSVFVNPTQFNDKEDLKRYPRTLDKDVALLEKNGCDYVFAPSGRKCTRKKIHVYLTSDTWKVLWKEQNVRDILMAWDKS